MSDREWPAWARQNEVPIAVADYGEYLRRPDGGDFIRAVYADGTVLTAPGYRKVECQTPEWVRQLMAALEFPGNDWDRMEWDYALRRANARREMIETLPAPSRQKEDAHV